MKLILATDGIVETYEYNGTEEPDILFYNKVFYVRYSRYTYKPATAFIDSKNHLINIKGEIINNQ